MDIHGARAHNDNAILLRPQDDVAAGLALWVLARYLVVGDKDTHKQVQGVRDPAVLQQLPQPPYRGVMVCVNRLAQVTRAAVVVPWGAELEVALGRTGRVEDVVVARRGVLGDCQDGAAAVVQVRLPDRELQFVVGGPRVRHGHVRWEAWGRDKGPGVDYLASARVDDFDGLAGAQMLYGAGSGWNGGHNG